MYIGTKLMVYLITPQRFCRGETETIAEPP